MQKYLLAAFLSSLSIPAMASCDKLRSEIDAKLQAKGITSYTLEIIPVAPAAAASAPAASAHAASAPAAAAPATSAPAKKSEGKVVGTCDGETKKIIYHRN